MISTGIDTRIKVQQIIENQLPEFILSESPKAVDFLKQYYISQEYTGGSIDLTDNLDQYLKLDNLTPETLKGSVTLDADINSTDEVINISPNTKGFPKQYGLLKIGSEIITYTGMTTNTFTGCQRGFSGITTYRDINNPSELVFSTSTAQEHSKGVNVDNLSSLFLQEFYKKIKNTFTPGLENTNFVSNLDVNNFIKEARTFYQSKGTEESFRILFNALYDVDPKIIDLEEYLIKPSSAKYVRRKRIVAEKLKGEPLNLKGQTISRSTDTTSTASVSEVEILTGISGISTIKDYFILDLFVGFDEEEFITGRFDVTGKTKVITDVSIGASVITVDSTVGFGTTGTIISGINTNIVYADKTVNQFLSCTGISNQINLGDDVIADDNIFGYENGDLTKKVELRITGVLSDFVSSENNRLSLENETIQIKSIGEIIENPNTSKSQKEIFANSWIYNTSSNYDIIDSISGTQSSIQLKSKIDKSSLRVGDSIQILEKKSSPFSLGTVVQESVIISVVETQNKITINPSFEFSSSKRYAIRRVIRKTSSSADILKYGNDTVTADVQNVYNESDESLYVASNSLPSSGVGKTTSTVSIPNVIENTTIQDFNSLDNKYSTISFSVPDIPFVTGDQVYYEPEAEPLVGLTAGLYFIRTVGFNKIKLFKSPAFIEANDFIEFGVPTDTSTFHRFTLANQYKKFVAPQKLLKKYPISVAENLGKNIETIPGPVGMLIDGVEIENGKSTDSIFYGPIENFSVIGFGTDYDIINPPVIEVGSVSAASTQALVSPVLSGDIKEIQVDPQNFDIEDVISIQLTGGNSGEAVLQPVLRRRNRVLEFSGVTSAFGGGVDTFSETITFLKPHNLISGQVLVYDKNKNTQLGIGTFKGSNLANFESLIDGQQYWPEVVGLSTIRLYRNETDYTSGINTIGFTDIAKSGIHKFKLKDAKNSLSSIRVIKSGRPYLSRKVFVDSSVGISTYKSIVTFKDHGFSDGELVSYLPFVGLGTTSPQSISGLSTTNQYNIIKIDNDNFRVANAGVGGTDNTNFIRKNHVDFKTNGTGYQLFKYPDVELTINAIYSVPTSDKINLTPVIQGQIIDASLYRKGSGYGSTDIVNYENKPNILIKNGLSRPGKNITPSIVPIISDGKLSNVNIQDGGDEYHSTPDLVVIGDGTGASLRAVIDRDENSSTFLKIIDVIILNSGTNYTFDNTRINIVARGKNAVFNSSVKKLSINNIQTSRPYKERYSNFALLPTNNELKFTAVGYSTAIGESSYGQISNSHSPIIGWAYDGNPIYGPFGYSDPLDNSSAIKILKTGYSIKTNIEDRSDLPFDLGFFVEDYSYLPTDSTDLDEHNGRYCRTPEYPNGVYAYFAGINTITKEPEFPYFIGNTYRSIPDVLDPLLTINQSFNFNNSKLVRNTFPYKLSDPFANNDFIIESNEILSQTTRVTSVSQGSIDSLDILKSGEGYKVNDNVVFDNSNTNGEGVGAFVSKLEGKPISDITTSYEKLENLTFIRKDPSTISVFVSDTHQLAVGNNLEISGLSTDIKSVSGVSLIGNHNISAISTESTILYKELPSNAVAGIVTDIFVYKTTDVISVGSSIGIGTEKLLVLNKFDDRNVLRVERGVTGTAHTLSSEVKLIPSFFDISFNSNFLNSKVDDIVYFNPKQAVGIATTVGITSAINVSVGDTTSVVSVPAQSIYLPNHPFKTGQEITFETDGNSVLEVSRDGAANQSFNLPSTGTSQNLFAINKSPNYIGIVTQVGLITSTNGLFFRTNGDDYFKYRFESNFNKITGNVERINSKVTLTTSHNLSVGDIVTLDITSNQSVGIGTSTKVRIKYNHLTDSLLINQVGFTSAGINTTNNTITLNSHEFKTGDKVYYDSTDTIASGLETGGYFIYRIDDDTIKLAETLYDAKQIPPNIVSIVSIGGSEHQLSLINPPINIIRDNNLVFDISDSSLSDFDFKIYQDENFNNDFVSTGKTTVNTVSTSGTIGVTSTATLTLNYSIDNPLNLFYNVEKSGFISTSDIDVLNGSKISYMDSDYNKDYSVVSVGTTDFDIRLKSKPETLSYQTLNTTILKYTTTSRTDNGSINRVNLISGGSGYKSLPKFVSVASTQGINAKLLPSSTTSNKIENTDILNIGFEYASDKTLSPIARLSPVVSTKNSDKIVAINVKNGGTNYTTPPKLVLQDVETKQIVDSGSLIANISQASQSINSVDIINTPQGIGNCKLFTKDNSSAIPITNITIGSTIITDVVSGIVTVTLATPIIGFTTAPFAVGDTIFVEGIENEYGDSFNSPTNKFNFYPVEKIVGSGLNPNPFILEFNIHGGGTNPLVTNPGLAKTIQSFAGAINFKDYPKFTVVTAQSEFTLGEILLVSRNGSTFSNVGLNLDRVTNNYIKIQGNFDLQENDKIKGQSSGSIATINSVFKNEGQFKVDFASDRVIGWSNDTGKLNQDYQVIPDNDYYQTLSYTIQSPIEYQTLVSPVNKLLHTTGLKNFADLGISTSVGVGSTSTVDSSTIIRDLSSENRVDAIDNFDLAKDVDTLSNPLRSRFVSFDTKLLSNFFECSTNRVLQIDNINSLFKNATNNAARDGFINLTNSFNRFLVQTRVPSVSVGIGTTTNTLQLTELLTSIDFVKGNIFTIQKGSINDEAKIVDILGENGSGGSYKLTFTPVDPFNSDLDVKILQQSFLAGVGVGNSSIGFVDLHGINQNVSASTTSTLISSNIANIDSYFATVEVNDSVSNENNVVEIYATHDGTNSYISNYSLETNTTNSIGTFTTNLDSSILSLNFENDRSNQVLVRSKVVGFGTTAVGIGTYRFKNSSQAAGLENSGRFESNFVSIASTAVIAGFTTAKDTSIKSIVRVSIGNTSALHQILMGHDGENTFITQYPFMTIGDDLGIGTFSSEYSGSNLNLKFHPDSSYISAGNLLVQSFNEILNTKLDVVNSTPTLNYGRSFDEISLLQYDALNSSRSNGLNFKLKNNNNPIFANFFNPATNVNLATGEFTIENNFFNKNERLIYTPGTSSVGFSSLIMSNGNPLPSEVYVVHPSGTVNSKVFQLSTTKAGAAITFNSAGSGNRHRLEMFKKNEKSLITIDDVIQSPISFTPITTTLSGNVSGQVSVSTSIVSLTGITSIVVGDLLKVDNEFLKVNNVGFGTTNVGPISNTGSLNLVDVSRGIVGSSSSIHTDTSSVRLFKGGYNIVGEEIFFVDPPRGNNILEKDDSNRDRGRSNFSGRVYLRQDYNSNAIFDDISNEFTGIGQTFTTTISGVNTTGITTGSAFVTINGIFQPPTTDKNPVNNYEFSESVGVTSFVFSGITSANGTQIISESDVNQNQLPRSGQIISIGFSGGLGIAPLAGASVTAVLGAGGSITSVGIGTRDFHGSGYRSGISTTGDGIIRIGIADTVGTGATVTATVGIGGTLIFSVVGGGSGYVNPRVEAPVPRYENLPVTGVSRVGVGATTDTGTGLLLNIDVGGSNTTGIGSTLFEVKSFEITRTGFGFRKGDVFKPVGLVTDKSLTSPITEVEFTVDEVFTDSFCSWNVGEFDYIDSIKSLQDGTRKRFPLNFNGELVSFERAESSQIDMQSLLLIFINGVVQNPGDAYIFGGGTSFEFTEAPDINDNVSIFFYKGTNNVDVTFVDVAESVKVGDEFQLLKNNNNPGFDQDVRVVSGITTSDLIETPVYFDQGIDSNNLKSFRWIKQKADKFINGELVTKVRPSIEPLVFPEARIIKDLGSGDSTIHIDNVGVGTNSLTNLFFYENPNKIGTIVFDESIEPRAADLTAVVSAGGTIQSITVNDGGKGYVGSSTALSIASPISNTGVALTASDLITLGIGSTIFATASANITSGIITSVSIVNPGFGYTTTAVPNVIAPTPIRPSEIITGFTGSSGFSGIVTAINVLSSSTIKFFLEKESGTFSGLGNGDPIYIFDTAVGAGVTSVVTSSGAPVGIGTSFFDNIYLISSYSTTSNTAEFVAGVKTDTSLTGISTSGISGKFSWGKLTGGVRSTTNPISVTISGKTVNSGLTTFPRIQRRNSGIRDTGALIDRTGA